jgi:hypothetical protein
MAITERGVIFGDAGGWYCPRINAAAIAMLIFGFLIIAAIATMNWRPRRDVPAFSRYRPSADVGSACRGLTACAIAVNIPVETSRKKVVNISLGRLLCGRFPAARRQP